MPFVLCTFKPIRTTRPQVPVKPRGVHFSWCWALEAGKSLKLGVIGRCKHTLHAFCLFTNHQPQKLLEGNFWGPRTEASERRCQIKLLWLLPFSRICNHHTDLTPATQLAHDPQWAFSAWRKSPQHRVQCTEPGNSALLSIAGASPLQALSEVPYILSWSNRAGLET